MNMEQKQSIKYSSKSDVYNRSKSTNIIKTKPKPLVEQYNFDDDFTTNQNNAIMQQIGFGKDFLAFPVDLKDGNKQSKEITPNSDLGKLSDIDFRTNNDFKDNGNPFIGHNDNQNFFEKKSSGGNTAKKAMYFEDPKDQKKVRQDQNPNFLDF